MSLIYNVTSTTNKVNGLKKVCMALAILNDVKEALAPLKPAILCCPSGAKPTKFYERFKTLTQKRVAARRAATLFWVKVAWLKLYTGQRSCGTGFDFLYLTPFPVNN